MSDSVTAAATGPTAHQASAVPAACKRVLVVTSTFPRWSGDPDPPFVYELAVRLSRTFDVHVLAPHTRGALASETLSGLTITRFRYLPTMLEKLAYNGGILPKLRHNPLYLFLMPPFVVGLFLAMVRLMRAHRFDAVHAHWLLPQGLIALLARKVVAPETAVVCTSHGGDLFGLDTRPMKWLMGAVLRHSDAVTVVSNAMREKALRLGVQHSKLAVIPMGVDLQRRFVPPQRPRRPKSLLFVGRLVEKKGLRYLLEALPLIMEHHPEVNLTVVGDGPQRYSLETLSTKLGLSSSVTFVGSIENSQLPSIFQAHEIVVFPSIVVRGGDQEGFGLVLVEALGCQCAVAAFDLPAVHDIIIDDQTGELVPQRDMTELARRTIRLLSNDAWRYRLGRQGRQHVLERYDWDTISYSYARLLLEAVSCIGIAGRMQLQNHEFQGKRWRSN